MGIILDLIILVIVVFTVVKCFKSGFVTSVWEAGKTVLSWGSALLFGGRLGDFFAEKYFDKVITNIVANKLSNINVYDIPSAIYELPEPLKRLMQICGVDIHEIVSDASSVANTIEDAAEAIALPISAVISNLIGYVVAFLGAYFIFLLIVTLLNKIASLPKLKQVNRVFGGCFGVVCSIVFVIMYVVATNTIAYIAVVVFDNDFIMNMIDSSYIFKFLSNIQLLNILNR